MDRLAPGLVAALSWNPQVRGALYVLIAVVILPGSSYLLLSTNVGARLGFQLAAAGLCAWMVVLGLVWWVYGIGLKGPAPEWKSKTVVTGDPAARGRSSELAHFPRGWKKMDLENPEVADAQAVVDGVLVPSPESGKKGLFSSASDYLPIAAREKGGETYGPLGLDFRPFNIFHKPHFLIIQVQKSFKPPAAPPPHGRARGAGSRRGRRGCRRPW